MPFLQLRSVMPSAWWLLVLPVRRGGMTESMTAASHWPVFTATGGFVMSLMFNLAVNGFHQPHRRCTQVPAALPLTGNIASGWRQPSGRVGQLPAGRKPQMGAGHDASRLPAAHPRHEPSTERPDQCPSSSRSRPQTPSSTSSTPRRPHTIRRFDHDRRTGIERRSTHIL
jgi:hypothetical protein